MRGIIAWFVDNPVAANLLMALLVVGGLVSLANTRQEEFPQVEFEIVNVNVPYLGATPEETEQGVCIRIEEALEGTENVQKMTSASAEGNCSVSLEFDPGTDMIRALNDIKGKVDAINTFPAETEKPIVSQATIVSEVADIVIAGNTDERTLKTLAQEMRDELAALPGVSQVGMEYVRPDEISIEVSELTLRRYGLTLADVASIVRRSSLDLPGGSIRTGGGEVLVRTQGQNYRGSDFEDIVVVTANDGTAVTLGEIGRVVDGFEEGDLRVRFDGMPAAMVRVFRSGNEDALEIADTVADYLDQARSRLPAEIQLVLWRDTAEELRARLAILQNLAVGGLILVLLALTLPLRFRLAMWVSAGIPISLLGAIMVFGPLDITLSTLTVMGFILVLGIVVDDAIVVGERIYAHERDAEDQRTAAINGAHEVAVPVIFGVLTTVTAFLPIIFVPGRMGAFFSVVGVVVILCLVFSIVECMLILPSHLSHRSRARDHQHNALVARWLNFQNSLSQGLEDFAKQRYGRWLAAAVEWRYTVLAGGVAVILLTLGLFLSGRIGFQFFPPIEGNLVTASLTMPEGITASETARAAEKIEAAGAELMAQLDREFPDNPGIIQSVLTSIGKTSLGDGRPRPRGVSGPQSHRAEIIISLLPNSERPGVTAPDIERRWRDLAGPIPGAVELRFSADLFSAGSPISIELRGRSVEQLREVAARIRGELARFDGVIDITDSFRSGKEEVKLSLRPEARVLGLTLNDLARQVRQAFYGEEAQRVQRGSEDVRVMVRYPEFERRSLGDLEEMRIRTANGTEVPFASVAEVEYGRGFSTIRRVDNQRVVTVTARTDRSVTPPENVLAAMQADVLPGLLAGYPSVSYRLTGEQEDRNKALMGLLSLFPMALLAIYAILAIPLKSYLQPAVIMSVIPFGVIGAVIGHMIMGFPIVFPSLLGVIALSGVVVNASLVMVDYVNRQRRQGTEVIAAVLTAGIVRFRPILLTSITTFVGLLPFMLNTRPETMFLVPMGISLAWGVLFATVITLFLVPCLYLILEDLHGYRARSAPAKAMGEPVGVE